VGNAFLNLTADQKTLSELQHENELLAARNAELEEAEQTARRLEELLDVQSSYKLQSIGARVIALSTSSWQSTLTIDKGSGAGLAVGMPVISVVGVCLFFI
jgi:rod shape-determining protein MreC